MLQATCLWLPWNVNKARLKVGGVYQWLRWGGWFLVGFDPTTNGRLGGGGFLVGFGPVYQWLSRGREGGSWLVLIQSTNGWVWGGRMILVVFDPVYTNGWVGGGLGLIHIPHAHKPSSLCPVFAGGPTIRPLAQNRPKLSCYQHTLKNLGSLRLWTWRLYNYELALLEGTVSKDFRPLVLKNQTEILLDPFEVPIGIFF